MQERFNKIFSLIYLLRNSCEEINAVVVLANVSKETKEKRAKQMSDIIIIYFIHNFIAYTVSDLACILPLLRYISQEHMLVLSSNSHNLTSIYLPSFNRDKEHDLKI